MKKMLALAATVAALVAAAVFWPQGRRGHDARPPLAFDGAPSRYGLYLAALDADIKNDFYALGRLYPAAAEMNGSDFLDKLYVTEALAGNESAAVEAARGALDKNPDLPAAAIYLAFVDIKNGDFRSAERRLRRTSEDGEPNVIIDTLRAWCLAGEKKYGEALELLDSHAEGRAFSKSTLVNIGLVSALAKDYAAADRAFAGLGNRPLDIYDLESVSAYYISRGRRDAAIKLVERELARAPSSISVASLLAAVKDGWTPPAVDTAVKGLAKSFFDISAGILMTSYGRISDLYMLYDEMALSLNPDAQIAIVMRAEAYRKTGRDDLFSREVARIEPGSYLWYVAWHALGSHLADKGDRRGEKILLELIEAEPRFLQAYGSMGDYWRRKDDLKQAIKWYGRGIDAGGADAVLSSLHFSRGALYNKLGRFEDSEADLERAIALAPNNPVLMNYLGYYLVSYGKDSERGEKLIEKAISLSPSNPYYIDSLGWAHFMRGDTARALRLVEFAYAMTPRNSVVLDHLGDIYLSLGRNTEAVFSYKKALAHFDPARDNEHLTAAVLEEKIRAHGR